MNENDRFVNPPLPYPYQSLEPFIDEKTMRLHHDGHLQTYVDNLNKVLENYPEYQSFTLEQLIFYSDYLPYDIRLPVKNNAGGVYNHIFYFSNLLNSENKRPAGRLSALIGRDFNSLEDFQKQFQEAAMAVFGSGYAWLVLSPGGTLDILTTANQDTPLSLGVCPILNIDVWEHAYYLKHYNLRADYVKNWFQLINWEQANRNLMNCFV